MCVCVTVLEWSVLHIVGPVGVVLDQTVCQSSRRVPDLRLHVVSSSPVQRTGIHREVCGGFSENSWRREERLFKGDTLQLVGFLLCDVI